MPEPFPDPNKPIPCRNEPQPAIENAVAEQPVEEKPEEESE